MIQAGRFFLDGSEKQSPYGNINFEESDVKHVDGAISMASTGDKVGGSAEFFICDGEQIRLDGRYAAFGATIDGLDVIHNIAAVEHDNSNPAGGGKPYTDIIINSITIE
jgi:cyclophilin family peptidyl-prolyl cis-trans isomerase